jgi:hypothetical protein
MVLVDPTHALGPAEGVDGADLDRLGRVAGAGRRQHEGEEQDEGTKVAHL